MTGGTGAAGLAGLAWSWMVGSVWLTAVAVVVAVCFGLMAADFEFLGNLTIENNPHIRTRFT